MTTFIYILICPIDGLPKYVGKSNNPDKRLKDHMLDFRCMDLNKAMWIRNLRALKLKPQLEIIDEVDADNWKDREDYWCKYFKEKGYELFNTRSRNGLTYKNSKTFQKGQVPWNFGRKKNTINQKEDLPF